MTKAQKQAAFLLNCPDGPSKLRENFGFKTSELRKIEKELNSVLQNLCLEWERRDDNA